MPQLLSFLIWRATRLVYLMRHPAVPLWLKMLPALAIGYVLFPHDFLRDYIPVIGWLDDIWVLVILMTIFMVWGGWYASRAPDRRGNGISTTYEVLDHEDDDKRERPKQ